MLTGKSPAGKSIAHRPTQTPNQKINPSCCVHLRYSVYFSITCLVHLDFDFGFGIEYPHRNSSIHRQRALIFYVLTLSDLRGSII